jgi:hypothetical protein
MERWGGTATEDMKVSISVALALALVACTAPYNWSGEWEGTIGPKPQSAVEGTERRVQLSILPGKDPVLTCLGFPAEGVLETSGREATFLGKTVMGQPLERQSAGIRETFSSASLKAVDQDTVEVTLFQVGRPVTVTLRRKSQPSRSR